MELGVARKLLSGTRAEWVRRKGVRREGEIFWVVVVEALALAGRRDGRETWEAFGEGGPWKRAGGGRRWDCFWSGLEGGEDDAIVYVASTPNQYLSVKFERRLITFSHCGLVGLR